MLVEAEEAKNIDTECLYTALYPQIQKFFKGLTATPPSYIGSRNNFPGPPWASPLAMWVANIPNLADSVLTRKDGGIGVD